MHKILSLSDSEEWSSYLQQLPINQQDVYYAPEYYRIYQNYGDGQALCFVFQEGANIALYPFFKNSINLIGYQLDQEYFDIQGVYGYNGILTNTEDVLFKSSFFDVFNIFCQKENIIAEFTRFHPLLKNNKFSDQNMTVIKDRKTVFLDLTQSETSIWEKSYSSNNRNMIRKALKNNVEIVESVEKGDYIEFYRIYVETMKNVNSGEYLFFNQQYFEDFIFQLPNNHKLILAKLNNEIIGGMVLMFHKDYAHYHLSGRKAEYGRYALNNLFLDFAIKEAKKLNCRLFHFGGGISTEEKDSLLKFKSNFSKDKSDFYIGKKIHNNEIYNKVVSLWRDEYPLSYEKNNKLILGYRTIIKYDKGVKR